VSRWFGTRSDDAYDDEVNDLYHEERQARRYQRQLAEHQHPNDPDNPDIDEGEDDEDK
jgi:hypothetical protein